MRAFIPTTGELSGLERDLRFHPSPVADPRTLTREQVAAFNREGYLKPLRIFDSREMASIRAYFDGLLARTLAAGGMASASHGTRMRAIGRSRRPSLSLHGWPSTTRPSRTPVCGTSRARIFWAT